MRQAGRPESNLCELQGKKKAEWIFPTKQEGRKERAVDEVIGVSRDPMEKKKRKKKSPSQGDAAESCLRNMIVWNEWRQLWKRGEGRPQIFMVLYTRALSIIPHRSAGAPAQLRHLEAALLAHNYTLPCHLLLKKQTKPQRFEDTTACRQQPQTPPDGVQSNGAPTLPQNSGVPSLMCTKSRIQAPNQTFFKQGLRNVNCFFFFLLFFSFLSATLLQWPVIFFCLLLGLCMDFVCMTSQVGAGCVCPTVPLLSLPTQAGKTELRTALVSSAGCFSLCLFYCFCLFFSSPVVQEKLIF